MAIQCWVRYCTSVLNFQNANQKIQGREENLCGLNQFLDSIYKSLVIKRWFPKKGILDVSPAPIESLRISAERLVWVALVVSSGIS